MKIQTASVRTWSCVHFTEDSFTNKAQFDMGRLKDDAVPIILDPTVMSARHKCVTVFITWSLFLCLLNRSFDMRINCFYPKSLQRPSVGGCRLSIIHDY